ncbi:hypothetical protein [Pseudoalteromonas sp. S16_S37]|uniref:hypothetical protein n=1 Tax=Pseudoalteromonas sp. S16_S37 TaxID=2720228 RepID=UPI001681BBDA|nr:hypothetical protein [Pseudoalteromonas sp. S16_S37]MBD1582814.1 hypothetical protein [Pseudoalteromonas sp. S16_S37]
MSVKNKVEELAEVDSIKYWQRILKEFLNHPHGIFLFIDTRKEEAESPSNKRLVKFVKDVGYLAEIDNLIAQYDETTACKTDNENRLALVRIYSEIAFNMLKELEYLESKPGKSERGFDYVKWSISAKGVDVALKLQEHEDNKKRHKASLRLHKVAICVSVAAVIVTALATIIKMT